MVEMVDGWKKIQGHDVGNHEDMMGGGGGDENDDGKNGGANLASCLVSTNTP